MTPAKPQLQVLCDNCRQPMLLCEDGWVCEHCSARIKPASVHERTTHAQDIICDGKQVVCKECDGYGWVACDACDGDGDIECPRCGSETECLECGGSGEVECEACCGNWVVG